MKKTCWGLSIIDVVARGLLVVMLGMVPIWISERTTIHPKRIMAAKTNIRTIQERSKKEIFGFMGNVKRL
jgi:hypothetical protein